MILFNSNNTPYKLSRKPDKKVPLKKLSSQKKS